MIMRKFLNKIGIAKQRFAMKYKSGTKNAILGSLQSTDAVKNVRSF